MGLADRACPAPLCTAGLFAMWMISTTMMGEGSLVLLMHFNKAPGKTRLSVFSDESLQDSQGDSLLGSLPKRHNRYASESPAKFFNYLVTKIFGHFVANFEFCKCACALY